MTLLHKELATAIITTFDIYREEDQALLYEAATLEPDGLGRIYEVLQLLPLTDGHSELLDLPIGRHGRLRELLGAGARGIALLESLLVNVFRDHAPRAIFDLSGRAADFGNSILCRILTVRQADPTFLLRNPLSPDCRTIDYLEERLIREILSCTAHPRSEDFRELILLALGDPDEIVRCAAARASVRSVGVPAIREALGACCDDDSLSVRRLALENLAPFVGQFTVAECIAAYRFDADPEIRREVLGLLLANGEVHYDDMRLGHLAFDPDPEIAETVWSWFDRHGIEAYLKELAARAKAGESLHHREHLVLTNASFVARSKCVMKLTKRLRDLSRRSDAVDQLVCTLRALAVYSSNLSADFWVEAGAIVHRQHHSDVTAAWQALEKKAGRPDAAPVATRRKKGGKPRRQPEGIG